MFDRIWYIEIFQVQRDAAKLSRHISFTTGCVMFREFQKQVSVSVQT